MYKQINNIILSGIAISTILVAGVFLNNSVPQNALGQMMDKEEMMTDNKTEMMTDNKTEMMTDNKTEMMTDPEMGMMEK